MISREVGTSTKGTKWWVNRLRREPPKGYDPFAEEAWGNEPYGNNEPYEPYEPYGRKTHKTTISRGLDAAKRREPPEG